VSAYHERDAQVHRLFHAAGKAKNGVIRKMESGLTGRGSSVYPCRWGQLAAKNTAPFGYGIPHTSGPVGAVIVCRKVSVVGRTPPCDWSGACHRNSRTEGACRVSATSPFGTKFTAYVCCSLPDQFLQNSLQHPWESQHPNGAHRVCAIISRSRLNGRKYQVDWHLRWSTGRACDGHHRPWPVSSQEALSAIMRW
jgi:hypothetical protein